MYDYPTEPIATANAVMSYNKAPEAAVAALDAAKAAGNVNQKNVYAFDALKPHVATLDRDGLNVLAACAEQIIRWSLWSKTEEAIPVRDAARARLAEMPPPAPPEE